MKGVYECGNESKGRRQGRAVFKWNMTGSERHVT